MISERITVRNKTGLHLRPATELAAIASKCKSDIKLTGNGKTVNPKSVIMLMGAGIKCGTEIEISCSGETAREDLDKLLEAIRGGFGEEMIPETPAEPAAEAEPKPEEPAAAAEAKVSAPAPAADAPKADAAKKSRIDGITRENWILGAFPEWGTWLNEEIDETEVPKGKFAMWWIGCTGLWIKSEGNTDIAIDLWFGNGKRTQKTKYMSEYHQMRNMMGARLTQPNLRAAPIVLDPFAVTKVDAVLSTHYHNDHIDPFFAAAVLRNCASDVPFIGPKECVNRWVSWGVPASRCKMVRPGDIVKVGDCEIIALDSFDRTCLVTAEEPLAGKCPTDMDDKAVNFLIRTPAGTIYHSGDSHYSIYYAKHGKDYEIDVALGSYGENPIGNQDKMTSIDILRMAESLRAKVVIPFHYDVWSNFKADPLEILMLYNYKKHVLQYQFKPFIWDVGGKFLWPDDRDKLQYHYRRGFEDAFTDEPNVPFRSIL